MNEALEIADLQRSKMWDFGWFDLSVFKCAMSIEYSDQQVIEVLIRDPIYKRSFCSKPDVWGAQLGRHGPYISESMTSAWFHRVDKDLLTSLVEELLSDVFEDEMPTDEQMQPVRSWIATVRNCSHSIYHLRAPDDERVRVEWSSI